ncbi:1947_t:CDS:2 [Gigaspora margarita]|uniref:1947_t:CDS:1 n=1 Tax=Gigaspora margarita TaxID=4874 RepID=A0ABN7UH84_GIGMA|nr:1947_t:CDS:2 [Gigaspora margarita]
MLAQKNSGPGPEVINRATRLFFGLANLDYKPGYNNHTYFQYLSNNKNDISLLDTYHPEEIFDKYIIRVAGKGFTVVNHPSEIYGIPDAHECIDGNLPFLLVLDIDVRQKPDSLNSGLPFLDTNKISREDLLSRILIACADILNSDLNHIVPLNAFILASLSNTDKCSWHIVYSYIRFIDYRDLKGFVEKVANRVGKPYSEFIDLGLYKSRFSLRLLGSAKGDRVKRPAISSVKKGYHELEDYLVQSKWDASEIWPRTFSSEKPKKEKFHLIENETTLSKGASLVITKYEWLEVGNIRKGFVNFQAQSLEACPICNICHEKDQLYGFLRTTKFSAKHKQGIVERIGDNISNPCPFIELSEIAINVEKLRDAPEAYPDFLNTEKMTILIRYDLLRQGKRVAFVSTGAVMARALVEKASKLSKSDNSPVKACELDCVAYTNTVEVGISFEVTNHFDIVIAITNIATSVHVEAFVQMLYPIRDSPCRIVSIFYQKNSNELFRLPGRENIRAELESARSNNLPTAIKGYRKWDNNAISYKIDESLAVITFIEVEHQKRLSARYFIEKLCSLIASTGASLQLIKMDESQGVIGNCKRIHNEVRVEVLVIKETDFNACSIADTMALKCFYMRNLYSGKDVNIDDWNNLCNKKFMECFSPPEPRKHFLPRENVKKSVAEDLHKLYSANYWKAIRELFQILGFTSIDNIHTLLGNIISEAFAQSCERFIEIQSQSLLLFGFKFCAKEKPDLISAIKTINAIASLGFGDKGALELPPYKPKTDNNIQKLFDSIGQDK